MLCSVVSFVYMLPKLPVVRNVRVAIKGDDVPKVIFLSARNQLERTMPAWMACPCFCPAP